MSQRNDVSQNPRTLESICGSDPDLNKLFIAENVYCGIKPTSSFVQCSYRATEPDENGLFFCRAPCIILQYLDARLPLPVNRPNNQN